MLDLQIGRQESTVQYVGESSRSGYQRGREHAKEMEQGKKTHPLVIHWEERHASQPQEILMRVVATANTALERQTWESVRIDTLARDNMEGCLNLKTEWGLSKNPSLVAKLRPNVQEMPGPQSKRSQWEGRQQETLPEPAGKRKRTESPKRPENPATETATEQEKGARKPELETGARTPVGVKVRRIQERIQKEKSHNV